MEYEEYIPTRKLSVQYLRRTVLSFLCGPFFMSSVARLDGSEYQAYVASLVLYTRFCITNRAISCQL